MNPAVDQAILPAALAGTFYPGEPSVLAEEVDRLLGAAPPSPLPDVPLALIVPHAAYDYSGPIAAAAYARLAAGREQIRRVIVIGPAHRAFVHGLALPEADALATPLGLVPIDREATRRLEAFRQVQISAKAHDCEHSIEVQLPFLQRLLPTPRVVPLAVGDATTIEVAEVIDSLWDDRKTVVVVSSDLSHYLSYDAARVADQATADRILRLVPDPVVHDEACGATPLNGLVFAARRRGLVPELIALGNSGDATQARPTAGQSWLDCEARRAEPYKMADLRAKRVSVKRPGLRPGRFMDRPCEPVVGYGSFAFYEAR